MWGGKTGERGEGRGGERRERRRLHAERDREKALAAIGGQGSETATRKGFVVGFHFGSLSFRSFQFRSVSYFRISRLVGRCYADSVGSDIYKKENVLEISTSISLI